MVAWTAPAGPWAEPHLHAFPADGHRYEIVDGCLHVTPPPEDRALVHQVAATLRRAAPPGWRPVSRIGLRTASSYVIPAVTVLPPDAPSGVTWVDPVEVALVVEVESPHSRRYDRYLKPGLYAEVGIASYWRIERTDNGAVAHLYTRPAAGQYELQRAVDPGECVQVKMPYPVQVAPGTWTG